MIPSQTKPQKLMSRREFDRLAPAERAAVMKRGCTLFDEPEPKRLVLRPGEMFRVDFEQLTPAERASKMKAGFWLVD
jgi:hypothetical protein